jgi:hypothetical protein
MRFGFLGGKRIEEEKHQACTGCAGPAVQWVLQKSCFIGALPSPLAFRFRSFVLWLSTEGFHFQLNTPLCVLKEFSLFLVGPVEQSMAFSR